MYYFQDRNEKTDSDFFFTSKVMGNKNFTSNKINNSLFKMRVTSIETTTDLYNAMEIYDLIIEKAEKKYKKN